MDKTLKSISGTRTVGAFMNGRACSDTLFYVLNRAFDKPMNTEERAAMPFAGGMMQQGYQCGMIWGGALAAGAQAFRLSGPGARAHAMAIAASQSLVESFRAMNKNINCLEITDMDKSSTTWEMVKYFLIKGGTIGCFRMAARYAPAAFDVINAAFSDTTIEAPAAPVSCSALLAERLGMSPMHESMAAGLAGGIGLCGGACGALGAAIWINGLKRLAEGADKIDFHDPVAAKKIDGFIKTTNFEFECSRIVGRKFQDVADHAAYVQGGGCANIIEVLAR